MKDRRDYDQAIGIIGTTIRAWDPYSLITEGAPSDEFDDQIAKITASSVLNFAPTRTESAPEMGFAGTFRRFRTP